MEDYKDGKIIKKEDMKKAMNKGFNPFTKNTKLLQDIINTLKNQNIYIEINIKEINEQIKEKWKIIVDKTETDWLICDECFEIYKKFI